MNLLVCNVIEREIEREKVQMKPPYSKKEVARNVMSISGGILQFSLAVSWQAGSFHRDFCSLCDNGEILLRSFVLFTVV